MKIEDQASDPKSEDREASGENPSATIGHLSEYVERLKADLAEARERAEQAEAKAERIEQIMESDDYGWLQRQAWDAADLPVPRLELRWERKGPRGQRCWYVLVLRHFEDGVVAHPIGLTWDRGHGARDFRSGDQLWIPLRNGPHAKHDAAQLGLPLCVTTTDGDVVVYEDGVQRWIQRASLESALDVSRGAAIADLPKDRP